MCNSGQTQTEQRPIEIQETYEPSGFRLPYDKETFGSDEMIAPPSLEFMYPFEFFPEPKLRLKLPDGNQLNIDDESDNED